MTATFYVDPRGNAISAFDTELLGRYGLDTNRQSNGLERFTIDDKAWEIKLRDEGEIWNVLPLIGDLRVDTEREKAFLFNRSNDVLERIDAVFRYPEKLTIITSGEQGSIPYRRNVQIGYGSGNPDDKVVYIERRASK